MAVNEASVWSNFLLPDNFLKILSNDWNSGLLMGDPLVKPEVANVRRRMASAAAMAFGALMLLYATWSVLTFSVSISLLLLVAVVLYLGGKSCFENRGDEFVSQLTETATKAASTAKTLAASVH